MLFRRFRRGNRIAKKTRRFIIKNGSALAIIIWILCGSLLATCLFDHLTNDQRDFLLFVYPSFSAPTDFISGCVVVISSAFNALILLMLLFLCGLTAFGWPLVIGVLFIFGFQCGISDCSVYCDRGLLSLLTVQIIPTIINGIAVVVAGRESLHMSSVFAKQLLPTAAHCGGVWMMFKKFLSYYLVCTVIIFVSAATRTIIMIYC